MNAHVCFFILPYGSTLLQLIDLVAYRTSYCLSQQAEGYNHNEEPSAHLFQVLKHCLYFTWSCTSNRPCLYRMHNGGGVSPGKHYLKRCVQLHTSMNLIISEVILLVRLCSVCTFPALSFCYLHKKRAIRCLRNVSQFYKWVPLRSEMSS